MGGRSRQTPDFLHSPEIPPGGRLPAVLKLRPVSGNFLRRAVVHMKIF